MDARNLIDPRLNFDPDKIYFFPELIDLAESQHRELLRRLARPTCLLVPKSAWSTASRKLISGFTTCRGKTKLTQRLNSGVIGPGLAGFSDSKFIDAASNDWN